MVVRPLTSPYSFNMTEKKLKKQIEIDYALAGSMMWQQANYNGLRTVTFFVIWLFNYDDEVAEPMGQHSDHSELARGVLRTAVSFVEHCLGLGRQEAIDLPKDPNISRFQVIGDQIRAAYTVEQRQLFFDEMKLYFHACEREQQVRQSGIVLAVEKYWTLRMGTSGVGLCSSLAE